MTCGRKWPLLQQPNVINALLGKSFTEGRAKPNRFPLIRIVVASQHIRTLEKDDSIRSSWKYECWFLLLLKVGWGSGRVSEWLFSGEVLHFRH